MPTGPGTRSWTHKQGEVGRVGNSRRDTLEGSRTRRSNSSSQERTYPSAGYRLEHYDQREERRRGGAAPTDIENVVSNRGMRRREGALGPHAHLHMQLPAVAPSLESWTHAWRTSSPVLGRGGVGPQLVCSTSAHTSRVNHAGDGEEEESNRAEEAAGDARRQGRGQVLARTALQSEKHFAR